MTRIFSFSIGLIVLLGLFFALVVVNNQALDQYRIDLTENQVTPCLTAVSTLSMRSKSRLP